MREMTLSVGLRILLGALGGVAMIAGIAVGVAEVRGAVRAPAEWTAIVTAMICVVIVAGGVLLLEGAWRGRIAVRDPAGRASRRRR